VTTPTKDVLPHEARAVADERRFDRGAAGGVAHGIPGATVLRRADGGQAGRWTLCIWGAPGVHDAPAESLQQRVFISNHTSTLDVFAVNAMALPNTRFFMSGFLRKFLPLGLIGYLVGIFWTVPQNFPERRVEIFKRAERVLRRSRESVYLSPEGKRVTTGEMARSTRSFHSQRAACAHRTLLYSGCRRIRECGIAPVRAKCTYFAGNRHY
jgi:1-acyl-sn-glycerol-3-phosphate acyltransferase